MQISPYDDLDLAIADEEHSQGRGFGVPDHCPRCDAIIQAARQQRKIANCGHMTYTELFQLASPVPVQIFCADCGESLDIDRYL